MKKPLMTRITSSGFSYDATKAAIVSQINYVRQRIDKLMTLHIDKRCGTENRASRQELEKIESQIRQLQPQQNQLGHRKDNITIQQKQLEKKAASQQTFTKKMRLLARSISTFEKRGGA